MNRSRSTVRLATILGASSLLGAVGLASAQDTQTNNFEGGGGGDPLVFENTNNWDTGGPDSWDLDGNVYDLLDGGISFDLDDDMTIQIDVGAFGFENAGDMHILSRTAVQLNGVAGTTYFEFGDNDDITTGDGALYLNGIDIYLQGDFTFNYGSGDASDPAMTFTQTFGTQDLNYNLIIDGLITDNGEGLGDSTLTFTGDGFALLLGGIEGGGETDDGEDRTQWTLELSNAASLMLAGGANYYLGGGVDLIFTGGSINDRENGHGILQVADGATLDTTQDGSSGGGGGGDISIDGWSAMLIGSIDLDADELEGLGLDENVATDAGGGIVLTNNVEMSGNSLLVVGDSGTITGEELIMGGSSTFVVQENGLATFDDLNINSTTSRFVNYGTVNIDGSVNSQGTMEIGGVMNVLSGFLSEGTLDIVDGGALNLTEGSAFKGTVNVAGSLNALSDFGFEGTFDIDGGSVEVGTYDANPGDQTVAELFGSMTISGPGTFTSHSNTTVTNSIYLDGGTFTIGAFDGTTNTESDLVFELENQFATFGGYGTLNLYNDGGLVLNGGTFFVGEQGEDGFTFGTMTVYGGESATSIDASGSRTEFAVGVDDSGNAENSVLDLRGDGAEGNRITFDDNSVLGIGVSGDNYIENGTVFDLIAALEQNNFYLENWQDLTIEQLVASNSVTRSFDFIRDENGNIIDYGSVTISSDYTSAAGEYGALGSWVGYAANNGGDSLSHQFDQISTAAGYQFALRQLQPVTFSSGLQVVADTQQFNVLREAVGGLQTQKIQGKPGPARRPLGMMSESLLAGQDEGDSIRSQFGYGIGPDAGTRREQGNDIVAFAQGYGRWVDLSNKNGVLGLSGNEWGIVAGAAGQLSDEWMLGALIGYDSFDSTLNDNAGTVDVSTIRVGPFVNWSDGKWIVDASIAGAFNDWRGSQNTGLGGTPSYDWSTHGYQIDVSGGLGYAIPVGGGVDLIPEGSIVYSWIHTDQYTGTTGINVQADDLNAIIGRLGARAQFNFISGLVLEGRLGWQGNYTFGGDIQSSFQNVAQPIPSTVDAVNRNNIYYGGQITWLPKWDLALTFRYEGRSGDGTDDQYIAGGLSIEF